MWYFNSQWKQFEIKAYCGFFLKSKKQPRNWTDRPLIRNCYYFLIYVLKNYLCKLLKIICYCKDYVFHSNESPIWWWITTASLKCPPTYGPVIDCSNFSPFRWHKSRNTYVTEETWSNRALVKNSKQVLLKLGKKRWNIGGYLFLITIRVTFLKIINSIKIYRDIRLITGSRSIQKHLNSIAENHWRWLFLVYCILSE